MAGPLADTDLAILMAFAGGALIAVWSSVVVAGFLPFKEKSEGAIVHLALIACAGALTGVLALVLILTVSLLPTAVAVITAGAAILTGPFLVEPIPDRYRESHLTLGAVVLFALAALAVLPWPF